MYESIKKIVYDNSLIVDGDRVLAAVSGGADSVFLLHMLCKLRSESIIGFELCAAHVNHCIRESAPRDEAFTRGLCEVLNVPLYTKICDVPEYARKHGYTLEQAGREVRYSFFRSLGFNRIAIAHHMDDQAESVLLHLFRGSGLRGMSGMQFLSGDCIRPLLSLRRAEIEQYLNCRGIAFCTDETNFLPNTTRNKLRLEVMPYISKNINSRAAEIISSFASLALEDDMYLTEQAKKALELCRLDMGYDRYALNGLPAPIRSRAIRLALSHIGVAKDIERKHTDAVCDILTSQTGTGIDLPNARAKISYNAIIFESAKQRVDVGNEQICVPLSPECVINCRGYTLTAAYRQGNGFDNNTFTAYMDADKLPERIEVRSRRNGDRFHPLGATGSMKLKDFFINKKVPRENRDIPLICVADANRVLFVPGFCVSDDVRVTSVTTKMLVVCVEQSPPGFNNSKKEYNGYEDG